MEVYVKVFKLLKESIGDGDFYIAIVAIIAFVLWLATLASVIALGRKIEIWKKERNSKFSAYLNFQTKAIYTLFLTMVSLFPLLGMFGTVVGLLGLNLTVDDMNNIRENFFTALTSTAWGIIFSVIFKILNGLTADYVEDKIELANKLTDELE